MDTITVFEKYSKYWPSVAVISAASSVITFGAVFLYNNLLVNGYLKLAAFCFFSLSLLSFFKWKDGQMKIDITVQQGNILKLDYSVREQSVASESFELDKFQDLDISSVPNRSLYNDFATGDYAVRFMKKGTDEWIYLNNVHGRVIPMNAENADKVILFLKDRIS